jgi:hypothetical protein
VRWFKTKWMDGKAVDKAFVCLFGEAVDKVFDANRIIVAVAGNS